MARVIGLGGFFFKTRDTKSLSAWYAKHLKLDIADYGGAMFAEDAQRPGFTLWSPFPSDTKYFGPGDQQYMVNFRVDDLHALLAELRAADVAVDAKVDETEYGKFGWITDPEGNRVELWEPPAQT